MLRRNCYIIIPGIGYVEIFVAVVRLICHLFSCNIWSWIIFWYAWKLVTGAINETSKSYRRERSLCNRMSGILLSSNARSLSSFFLICVMPPYQPCDLTLSLHVLQISIECFRSILVRRMEHSRHWAGSAWLMNKGEKYKSKTMSVKFDFKWEWTT